MLSTLAKAAAPAARAASRSVKPAARRMATESAVSPGHVSVSPWSLVATSIGAGVGVFGIFANLLHGDNVRAKTEMREDMQKARTELREDMQKLEGRIDQRFEKIDQRFEKIDQRFEKIEESLKVIAVAVTKPGIK